MDNSSGEFDYGKLADLIIDQVKKITGCDAVETGYSGPQLPYPFFSYKITSPHIKIIEKMNNHEQFEMTVSINCRSENSILSLNLAGKLAKWLETEKVRRELRQSNVVVVGTDSFGDRDLFQSDEYERIVGFDLHLRVVDNFEEIIPNIEKINLND